MAANREEVNAMNKFARVREVDMELLREQNVQKLQGNNVEKKNSVMTLLALKLNLKATGQRWDRLCTLKKGEHLRLVNGTRDTFSINFIGENNRRFARQVVITDERYANALREILDSTEENGYLFTTLKVFNKYLDGLAPLLKSNDFRTYNANVKLQNLLNDEDLAGFRDLTDEERIRWAQRVCSRAVSDVARMLNVQNQTVKKCHVDPRIIASWCKYTLHMAIDDARKVVGLKTLTWGIEEIYVILRREDTPFRF